ncbi:hypothetical protein UFOVP1670_36 [uncultured Caudovirales phage]|uniref:Lipoprotein n=1 Tax=uncultured Caudovirales phage TaxID=2100421 RepID=A0A6J5T972_9CAUD|nr:hypothetical protein UFOVP1670_36 [uncultured Caudovirales phage]
MKRTIFAGLLAGMIWLAGCATPVPNTPAQAVYAAHGTYVVALTAAVAYKKLPNCNTTAGPALCAKPEIVTQLQKADDEAFKALAVAQTLARTTTNDTGVKGAVDEAVRLVGAFSTLATSLRSQ